MEKSLGGVEDNVGTIWSLNTRMNYAAGKAYPRLFANYDHGFLTPINNAPIWIRTSVGRSFGDKSSPFANFYFGGFGNNYIDKLESNRYRQYDSFPGVEINAIGADNYAKGLVEWNLPAWKFAHLGDMYLYCNWARLSLFSSGLLSNIGRGGNSGLYANIGAQLDFRIVLFSYLNSTFSVGYAKATDRHGKLSDEVMVSLKIL